ncbi:MAG: hypothetical protein PF484_02300 [Bacteroidales bacterium]|jgi:hypothetical protein|nr:hypothetical protein [Bacteroidales bacterium]
MKTRFIFHILLMTAVIFLASCVKEGPAGLAGADGADGADGTNGVDGQDGQVTCLVCHGGSAISSAQFQYAASVHKVGEFVGYAGGRSYCAECHSSEGFIEFQTTGDVASNISMPSAFDCETCHPLHTTFGYADFGLRADGPVELKMGATLDLGGASNLCINCHQSRRAEPNVTNPGEETFAITSTHYGPHHGAQANVLAGIGFAEIAGSVDYPVQGTSKHLEQASCTACHMGDYVDGEGGHTWNPSLASCQECHATTSFDYGGVQTDMEAKFHELRELLIAAGVVEGDDEHGYHPVVGTHPMVHAQAFFNWVGLEEDRSFGVHNPQYVNALLTNSIDAMKVVK